jgi:hypothetical protein
VEFFGERMNMLQNVLKQKTSLVAHIRNVISRFVQAGSINKKKSTRRHPKCEELVKN